MLIKVKNFLYIIKMYCKNECIEYIHVKEILVDAIRFVFRSPVQDRLLRYQRRNIRSPGR